MGCGRFVGRKVCKTGTAGAKPWAQSRALLASIMQVSFDDKSITLGIPFHLLLVGRGCFIGRKACNIGTTSARSGAWSKHLHANMILVTSTDSSISVRASSPVYCVWVVLAGLSYFEPNATGIIRARLDHHTIQIFYTVLASFGFS